MTAVLVTESPDTALPAVVRRLFAEDVTESSLRAYRADLRVFATWCATVGETPLPCTSAALIHFLTVTADSKSIATVERYAAAVSWAHRKAGHLGDENPRTTPVVRECLRLLRRRHRDQVSGRAPDLNLDQLRELLITCGSDPNKLQGVRDAAMILLGFAGAFRRSELAAIKVEHIKFVTKGVEIFLPWSKSDQEGKGILKRIGTGHSQKTCPVKALRRWLEASNIQTGPVFRGITRGKKISSHGLTDKTVYRVFKRLAKDSGVDDWENLSPHSMRSGFASEAAENGASLQSIKAQGGWRSDRSALGYIRARENWESAASLKLGL